MTVPAPSVTADQARRLYDESRRELRAAGRHRRRAKKLTQAFEQAKRDLEAMGIAFVLEPPTTPTQPEGGPNGSSSSPHPDQA